MHKDCYLIFVAMYGESISLNTDPNAEFRSQNGGLGGTESSPSLKPKVQDDGVGGYKQSLTDIASVAVEGVKFLDPTGILSWGDVKAAYDQFIRTKSYFDGTMLVLAVGSVIPIGGKFVTPVKIAAKNANKIDRIGGIIKNLFRKFEDVLFKETSGAMGRAAGKPTEQVSNKFQQQFTQQGIKIDVLRDAFEKAISSANETQKELARVVRKTNPNQQIPNMFKFTKTINSRWNYGSMTYTEAERMLDGFVQNVDNLTRGMQFDPSKIKVLDYDFFGNSGSARQIMELELNGGKFLIYSSGTGTSGKTLDASIWSLQWY